MPKHPNPPDHEVVASLSKPNPITASAWSATDILLRLGIQFAVMIVLARLLAPEDFGIFALLTFLTSFSIVFLQGGLTIALIQRQNTSHHEQSAIFWWNLCASLIVGVGLVVAAPMFAAFFDQPILGSLVLVAAAHLVLSAAGAVHSALLMRDLRFDLLTKAGIASSLLSGAAAVCAAIAGAGIWALAIQLLVQPFVNALALWILSNWRPALHFSFATIRSLFGFGAWVSVGNIMEVIYTSGISLLIGKLYGMRDLGFYNRAATTQMLPSSTLSMIIGRVTLPLLAAKGGDPASLRESLRLAIGAAMIINVPMMIGIALLAEPIVLVLFGDRWLPVAPILAILAISAVLLPMHVINLQYVLSGAQSGAFMRIEVAKKTIGIVCIVIGSLYGVMGLAWSQVIFSVIALLINAAPAHDQLGYGPLRQIADVGGIFIASIAMALAVFALDWATDFGPFVSLASGTAVGFVVYLAVGWFAGYTLFRASGQFLAKNLLAHRTARHH